MRNYSTIEKELLAIVWTTKYYIWRAINLLDQGQRFRVIKTELEKNKPLDVNKTYSELKEKNLKKTTIFQNLKN